MVYFRAAAEGRPGQHLLRLSQRMGRCDPGKAASGMAGQQVFSPSPSFSTLLACLDFLAPHLSKSASNSMLLFPAVVVLHTLCHGLSLDLL